MPGPPRADEAGGLYHALNHSKLRATIFHKDVDFEALERILDECLQIYHVEHFSFQWRRQRPQWMSEELNAKIPEMLELRIGYPQYQIEFESGARSLQVTRAGAPTVVDDDPCLQSDPIDGSVSSDTAWQEAASDQFHKHLSIRALIVVIDCQRFCREITISKVHLTKTQRDRRLRRR